MSALKIYKNIKAMDPHIRRVYNDYQSYINPHREQLSYYNVLINSDTLLDFRLEQVYELCGDTANYGKVKHMYKPLLDEAIENDYDSTKIDELFIKSLYLLDNDLDNHFKQTLSEIDVIIQASV